MSPSESRRELGRVFLHEPGWRIALKIGNVREFCYQMAPGQDYYHRLLDGEVYLHHGDERLCVACAERRGLLSHHPKLLEAPMIIVSGETAPTGLTHVDPIALVGDDDATGS